MREGFLSYVKERIFQNPVLRRIRDIHSLDTSSPLYLVGGALRDCVLGRSNEDFDFVVCGDARRFAEALSLKLKARYITLDEDWGVARLVWPPRKNPAVLLSSISQQYRVTVFRMISGSGILP